MRKRPLSAELPHVARPIVKWAGGKGELVSELVSAMPRAIGTYVEPFAGGAALFFALASEPRPRFVRAHLNDRNAELVASYRAVRDDVDARSATNRPSSSVRSAKPSNFPAARSA
jgi:DNA adenine methylase